MVNIVLVNWRGWQDTILCLQSLFRLRGDFRVIVCDNASDDESVPMLRATSAWLEWARRVGMTTSRDVIWLSTLWNWY